MADPEWTSALRDFATLRPHRSFATEAANALREFILLGKLAPGVAVPERDLAEAFGISRTPLKEALRILETEGLIVYGPTRRPRVADPSLHEINDWLRVQGALESLGGELACVMATNQDLAKIAEAHVAFRDKGERDPLAAFRQDMLFHRLIVSASKNDALVETHATYNARLWRVRFLSSQRVESRDTTAQEHDQIVAALTSRDAEAARDMLRHHLRTAEQNIAALMADSRVADAAEPTDKKGKS